MIRLSDAVAALLDLVQFRLGVSIEVLTPALRPVQPALQGDFAGVVDEPGVREACLTVLRTGESRVERRLPSLVAIYPARLEREVVGVILISRAGRREPGAAVEPDDVDHLQTVGLMARAIIEHDLVRSGDLSRESERIRRLQGILRFIGQLRTLRHGRDMMQAVVQAATVWFDLDCRIYQLQPGGDYGLVAALPGLDTHELRPVLDGARLRRLIASRIVSSITEVEFLTGPARRGGALVLGAGLDDELVLVLIGVIDAEVELTAHALAQALGGELQIQARRRLAHWRSRLAARAFDPGVPAERVLLDLIEELCVRIGAAGGRVSIQQGGEQRTIAALEAGGEAGERLMRADPLGRHARTVTVGAGAQLQLEFWGRGAAFDAEAIGAIDAWLEALEPWLNASPLFRPAPVQHDVRSEERDFERLVHQEVERAKRFDLGLALLLIEPGAAEPGETLVDTVRRELRASDLFGRVRGGRMAVVLVHSGPEAARSVSRRIKERLDALFAGTHRDAVRLGEAVFSPEHHTGDALISAALTRMGRGNSQLAADS